MKKSIFELETGVPYEIYDFIVTCHVCSTTFSPTHIILIPTRLCQHYSGTYKRLCMIYYVGGNICNHVTFYENWGSIFCGDIEALPLTILSSLDIVKKEQPDHEEINKAWLEAKGIFEKRKLSNV